MGKEYPPATPHGEIKEIFQDVFFVTGSVVMAPGFQISRNMIIVRCDSSLTLISTVRLDDEGLKALDALGKVEHVIKLGAYHLGVHNGMDDPFYIDRYNARLWAMPEMEHKAGMVTSDLMTAGAELPIKDASLFVFETSKMPEGLILIDRAGGILVSCDSLQNGVEADAFFSELGATRMQSLGFIRPANIGPEWLRACEPEKSDFTRIIDLDFQHLLPSHGRPIQNTAKEKFSASFKDNFSA